MIFLLIISIIFNFVNLFIIIIIWKRFSLSDLTSIDRAKNEIEDLLIAYTAEMKDDNEKLMKLIDSGQVDANKSTIDEKVDDPISEYNINTLIDDKISLEKINISNPTPTPKMNDYIVQEKIGKSIKDQAVTLSKKGLTQEEIAKRLGKGKGEIELLLKFNKD